MYTENFTTRTYETDYNNRLRISSLLNYMQEAAAIDANQLGFGFKAFSEKGLFWVLSRVQIAMDAYPLIGEPLSVETWPKSLHKLFAVRDFLFRDWQGQVIGKASTAWLIVNRQSRRPVRPEGIMQDVEKLSDKHAIERFPDKILPPEGLTFVHAVQAAYSDIDVNRHVNNVKYIEYVLNTYKQNELDNAMISALQVNFLNECRFGDEIRISKGHREATDYFEGIRDDGTTVFQLTLNISTL